MQVNFQLLLTQIQSIIDNKAIYSIYSLLVSSFAGIMALILFYHKIKSWIEDVSEKINSIDNIRNEIKQTIDNLKKDIEEDLKCLEKDMKDDVDRSKDKMMACQVENDISKRRIDELNRDVELLQENYRAMFLSMTEKFKSFDAIRAEKVLVALNESTYKKQGDVFIISN